jgi:osmotically-inducible protein OsmY
MRRHAFPLALAGAMALTGAACNEKRPEAADRPPAAEARPAEPAAKPDTGDRTGAATETADVKLALSMDKIVDASDINVDTDAATKTVILKGSVASAEQRTRAAAIAEREAEGYKVDNQLVVKRKDTN